MEILAAGLKSSQCFLVISVCVSAAEDDVLMTPAEFCPSLADCSLMCVNGYQRRPDGCYVCQCVETEFGQFCQLVEASLS